MEQMVRVRKTFPDGTAEAVHIRESACSGDCHKCSGCGAAQESVLLRVDNPIGAKSGDLVRVEGETAPVLKAAAVLYMLPLALFFLGYYLGTLPGAYGALGGGLGFAAGIGIVVVYDRLVLKKADLHYTITAFVGDPSHRANRKEVHDHG